MAASRIVWEKFFNAGQTCIAPDYLLVEKNIHADLILRMKEKITAYYSETPQNSPDLARIINQDHFKRLVGLLDADKVVHGGQTDADTLYIAPTILDQVTMEDVIMGEEIFGPILPVITFENLEEALEMIQMNPLSFHPGRIIRKKDNCRSAIWWRMYQ